MGGGVTKAIEIALQAYDSFVANKAGDRFMVLSTTFNNISVISLLSVLLVEVPGENHRSAVNH